MATLTRVDVALCYKGALKRSHTHTQWQYQAQWRQRGRLAIFSLTFVKCGTLGLKSSISRGGARCVLTQPFEAPWWPRSQDPPTAMVKGLGPCPSTTPWQVTTATDEQQRNRTEQNRTEMNRTERNPHVRHSFFSHSHRGACP